jgi:hypothetical protein
MSVAEATERAPTAAGVAAARPTVVLSVLAIGLVGAATLLTVVSQRPGLNSDPGWGIVAAEQFLIGRSPTPLDMVEADPIALTQDRVGRVAWWPPSYQLAPLAFRALGLDWGNALRATFVVGWLAGGLAWALVFARTIGTGPALFAVMALFLLLRFSHADASIYSGGEFLLWAAAPSVVLVNLMALTEHRARRGWAAAAGALTPWLFLVKFNAAFTILGLGAAWTWLLIRRWIGLSHWVTYAVCGCAGSAAIIALGFPSGTTTFDPDVQLRLSWVVLWPFGSALFAATDWDSLLRWLLQHPSSPLLTDRHFEIIYAMFAVPVLIAVGLSVRAAWKEPVTAPAVARIVALTCFTVAAALLAFIAAESRSYLMYARYLRVESLLVLPLVLAALIDVSRSGSPRRRAAAALAILVLLVVPAAYGASALVTKGWLRAGAGQRLVADGGIRYDFFRSGEDVPRILAELKTRVEPEVLLYLPSPELGLAFADRRFVIRHADFVPIEELSAARFAGVPPSGVALLVPEHFTGNGKLAAIQQSFSELHHWTRIPLTSTEAWLIVRGTP